MIEWLKRFFFGEEDDADELAALQDRFQRGYAAYLRLLRANQQAVETIAEIEVALGEGRPLAMAQVRALATRMGALVFRMIQNLDTLSGQRYEALYDRFTRIQAQLNPILFHVAASSTFPPVVPLGDATGQIVEQVGAKMAVLGELGALPDVAVPRGFVITASGYRRLVDAGDLQRRIDRRLLSAAKQLAAARALEEASAEIRALILAAEVPADLAEAIRRGYHDLCAREGRAVELAVRSSALGEDGSEMSFAGQYESVLGVRGDDLLAAYLTVVASKYSPRAIKYRSFYGLRDDDVVMCVGCLTMVDAVAGGVIYTRHPIDPQDRSVTIYATRGAPETVVDGSARADAFVVARESLTLTARTDTGTNGPPLADEVAVELARIALTVERRFGTAQDIEWALGAGGEVVLLQSRPLAVDDEGSTKSAEVAAGSRAEGALITGGVTASGGGASGPVRLVLSPADERAVEPGAVLVTERADPRLAALLDRAAAVVAEQGSVACHLATVAREFGVPALFGVSGATAALADAGTVTVDADRRAVHAGRIGKGLVRSRPAPQTDGSPVHQALAAAAAQIVPLGLLDPDAPSFAAESCETFHDITRFCHETAAKELLRFGAERGFPRRASRRLFTDVATQFWVVDLDDGLVLETVDPHFVRLEEVRSVPMLALWRGLRLGPWGGPPPVDAKGFLGLLAGAATDPNLEAAAPSDYGAGSHFFISAAYCSFQYRVGYHLATVEALVGPGVEECSVRFQFSGGGAGPERKQRRARLIAELLEHEEFRVKLQQDVIAARLDRRDAATSERALVVLGYLLTQTRQLDVALADEAAVAHHRQRLLAGIAELVDPR